MSVAAGGTWVRELAGAVGTEAAYSGEVDTVAGIPDSPEGGPEEEHIVDSPVADGMDHLPYSGSCSSRPLGPGVPWRQRLVSRREGSLCRPGDGYNTTT